MKFFYYCFYRISRAYEKLETDAHLTGNIIVAMCFSFNVLALTSVSLSFAEKGLTIPIIATVIIFFSVLNLFIMNKKKYLQLSERWQNEKHKKLKGWLVVGYIVLSLVFFFYSLAFLNPAKL